MMKGLNPAFVIHEFITIWNLLIPDKFSKFRFSEKEGVKNER